MCANEDVEHHSPQLKENEADLADVGKHLISAREDIVRQSLHIQDMKSDLAVVRGDVEDVLKQSSQFQENLEDIVSREVKKATRCLEEKLDALLAKLSKKE